MLGKEMILNIDEISFLINPLECMAAIAVVVTPSIRSTVITEKHHACMVGLGRQSEKVEQGVII